MDKMFTTVGCFRRQPKTYAILHSGNPVWPAIGETVAGRHYPAC